MTHSLKDLLGRKARAGDATFPIKELFADPATHRLRYAALDVGGWFDRHEVLISLRRFASPGADDWQVDMSREAVEDAPRWEHPGSDLTSLPPLVVGPFGNTFSPLLLSAHLHATLDEAEQRSETPASLTDANGRIAEMDPASPWLGREALGADGPIGHVIDVTLDDDLTLRAVQTDRGEARDMHHLREISDEGQAIFG